MDFNVTDLFEAAVDRVPDREILVVTAAVYLGPSHTTVRPAPHLDRKVVPA